MSPRVSLLVLVSVLVLSCLGFADAHKGWRGHHGDKHDLKKYGHALSNDRLTTLYNERVECRRCVRDNPYFEPDSNLTLPASGLPSYAPSTPMQWCPTTDHPTTDYEGSCMDMSSWCAVTNENKQYYDKPIYCANDQPSSKLTCSLCVMDGFYWTFSRQAKHMRDEYNGSCSAATDSSTLGEWTVDSDGNSWKTVAELKDCVKLSTPKRWNMFRDGEGAGATVFLATYFWITLLLGTCFGIRICVARRARLARARAAAMASGSTSYNGTTTTTNSMHQSLLTPAPLSTHNLYTQAAAPVTYSAPVDHYSHAINAAPVASPVQQHSIYVSAAVPQQHSYAAYPTLAPSAPHY